MDRLKGNRSTQLDFSEETKRFLCELFGESIGSPSVAKKLDAIIEMERSQAGVPAEAGLIKEELSIVHGLQADVLKAIDNFTDFVKENLMTLKEDFATLQGKFDTMEGAVTAVAEDIAALKNEIKEANERANIDLSPLVARAEGIEAGLRTAAGSQAGSDPDAPPGGGETGGETGGESEG